MPTNQATVVAAARATLKGFQDAIKKSEVVVSDQAKQSKIIDTQFSSIKKTMKSMKPGTKSSQGKAWIKQIASLNLALNSAEGAASEQMKLGARLKEEAKVFHKKCLALYEQWDKIRDGLR